MMKKTIALMLAMILSFSFMSSMVSGMVSIGQDDFEYAGIL